MIERVRLKRLSRLEMGYNTIPDRLHVVDDRQEVESRNTLRSRDYQPKLQEVEQTLNLPRALYQFSDWLSSLLKSVSSTVILIAIQE